MHGADTTTNNQARQNILDPRFLKFGMGAVRGKDGMIYVCQLFQGLPSHTTGPNTNTNTSETQPIKNPRTRIVPTLKLDFDPVCLSKHRRSQNLRQSDNKASHRRTIPV
jgi:hypothetical protein